MCIMLACSTASRDVRNVAEKAVRALFVFGGDPDMALPPDQNRTSMAAGYYSPVNSSLADWSQLPGCKPWIRLTLPVIASPGVHVDPPWIHVDPLKKFITLNKGQTVKWARARWKTARSHFKVCPFLKL